MKFFVFVGICWDTIKYQLLLLSFGGLQVCIQLEIFNIQGDCVVETTTYTRTFLTYMPKIATFEFAFFCPKGLKDSRDKHSTLKTHKGLMFTLCSTHTMSTWMSHRKLGSMVRINGL